MCGSFIFVHIAIRKTDRKKKHYKQQYEVQNVYYRKDKRSLVFYEYKKCKKCICDARVEEKGFERPLGRPNSWHLLVFDTLAHLKVPK